MIKFYWKLAITFLCLLLFTTLCVYLGFKESRQVQDIFPMDGATLPWIPSVVPEQALGETWLAVQQELGTIEYQFNLDPRQMFPYTHYSMVFIDEKKQQAMVDLSRFKRLSFNIACEPNNFLLLAVFTFDDITELSNPATRRVSSAAFSCEDNWKSITLPFTDLITPDWWLEQNRLPISARDSALNKTLAIALINSRQSPRNTLSTVKLSQLRLEGEDPAPFYTSVLVSLLCWLIATILLVGSYIGTVKPGLLKPGRKNHKLLPYEKIVIEPKKDKEKDKERLLTYLAKEYNNSNLSLELAASSLGINRTKINELLKEELGLTFTAYLNSLRLTEAARLLTDKEDISISKIAYLVGYKNVSYFNKLFKTEYGCTPKAYKNTNPS